MKYSFGQTAKKIQSKHSEYFKTLNSTKPSLHIFRNSRAKNKDFPISLTYSNFQLNRSYSVLHNKITNNNRNGFSRSNPHSKGQNTPRNSKNNIHKYQLSHLSYEVLSVKKVNAYKNNNNHNEENASLKHDILILLNQLKQKDCIINEFNNKNIKEQGNNNISYLVTLLNDRIKEFEVKVEKLKEKNEKLKQQLENANKEIKRIKMKNLRLEKQLANGIETPSPITRSQSQLSVISRNHYINCKQYSFSYMVTSTTTSSMNSFQNNNNNIKPHQKEVFRVNSCGSFDRDTFLNTASTLAKDKDDCIFYYNCPFSIYKNNINYISNNNIILKPYDSSRFIQYDINSNNFKVISFVDYSDYQEHYEISNMKYITIGTNIYIITGKQCDKLYCFNILNKQITKLNPIPNAHIGCGLLQYNNSLLCISGKGTKIIDSFSLKLKKWINNLLPDLIKERTHACYSVINNSNIIACYGFDSSSNKYLNDIEIFDSKNNEWKLIQIKFKNYWGISEGICFNKGDIVYIFGGNLVEDISGTVVNGNKWKCLMINIKNSQGELIKKEENDNKKEPLLNEINSIKNNSLFYGGVKMFEDMNYSNDGYKSELYVGFDTMNNIHKFYANNLVHKIEYY